MNEHPKYYITYMKFHDDAIHDSATGIHKEKMMNERINELKESARPEIDWAARYHVELNSGEKEKWMNEWFEKFAELIVRECISSVGSQADKAYLKKHFGLPVESDIVYPATDESWSVETQYKRKYNIAPDRDMGGI
jgi:hypothetical protein